MKILVLYFKVMIKFIVYMASGVFCLHTLKSQECMKWPFRSFSKKKNSGEAYARNPLEARTFGAGWSDNDSVHVKTGLQLFKNLATP